MDIADLLFIIATVIFAVDAYISRSIQSGGLAFFAAAFVVKSLL